MVEVTFYVFLILIGESPRKSNIEWGLPRAKSNRFHPFEPSMRRTFQTLRLLNDASIEGLSRQTGTLGVFT